MTGGKIEEVDPSIKSDIFDCLEALNYEGILTDGRKIIPKSKAMMMAGGTENAVTVFTEKGRFEVKDGACTKAKVYQGMFKHENADTWGDIFQALPSVFDSILSNKHLKSFNRENALAAAKQCALVENFAIREAARKAVVQLSEGESRKQVLDKTHSNQFQNGP